MATKKFKLTTISKKTWDEKKKHGYASIASGYYGIPKGTKCILEYDRKHGTILVPVKIRKKRRI